MPEASGDVAASLSIIALFAHADIVVKAVMILLVAGSVWAWAVIIDKAVLLRRVARQADAQERRPGDSAGAAAPGDPAAAVVGAGLAEHRALAGYGEWSAAERRERIERAMRLALGAEIRRLELRLPYLATLGSAAPFIGLFGTVWGIMNSFTAIAATNNTSLAVVAPGIAEALFATATGLAAAISAVIAYNKLTVELGRFAGRMNGLIGRLGGELTRTGP